MKRPTLLTRTLFALVILLCLILFALAVVLSLASLPVQAASVPKGDFSLEVSPSPLVAEVKPGESKTLELKIHNASLATEQLKIQARGFTTAHPSGDISITPTTPPDLAQWISFSHPTFSLKPGEWFTQKISINLPEDAGFSYPFIAVVSRADSPEQTDGGATIQGSIAVFTLINVDKPGATRRIALDSFTLDQNFYEYLPATFNLKFKNTGNSIVQPYGNIYVQRPGQESTPLAVLPVNETGNYLLPGGTKEVNATWSAGFPHYENSVPDKDGKTERTLKWNWENISQFRFGRYTAQVVAVYNDGTRDVPVIGAVSFWVIPWRILLGALVVLLVIAYGVWSIIKRLTHHAKRLRRPRAPPRESP